MNEMMIQAARTESDIFSILNIIGNSISELADVQCEIDNAGFSMAAIHLDQAIECLRKEYVALNLLFKTP